MWRLLCPVCIVAALCFVDFAGCSQTKVMKRINREFQPSDKDPTPTLVDAQPESAVELEKMELLRKFVDESNDPINVYVVPHSHTDPGWLRTFDDYYSMQVQQILDTVISSLNSNPSRTFVWGETSFFERWWRSQPVDIKEKVRTLVAQGRFEFVHGGWVQQDEASPTFEEVADQMAVGHRFLMEEFGVAPRVAWQIDPFGHSSMTPEIFANAGFDALVINRVNVEIKSALRQKRQLEFIWRPSVPKGSDPATDDSRGIFTHVLFKHYSSPTGFDFEKGASGSKASSFIKTVTERATAYRTRNLMVLFGDDFKFQEASRHFSGIDKLISEVRNMGGQVNMFYATPSQYFDAVHKFATKIMQAASNTALARHGLFPTYSGDFFPYADGTDSYWTGYFSSRPHLKQLAREASAALRNAEFALAVQRFSEIASGNDNHGLGDDTPPHGADDTVWSLIDNARKQVGLVMHHDAITGTAKSKVNSDYSSRLRTAIRQSHTVLANAVAALLGMPQYPIDATDKQIFLEISGNGDTFAGLNELRPGEALPLVVYNSQGWDRSGVVTVVVDRTSIAVLHGSTRVVAQVSPVSSDSLNKWRLSFVAHNVPAAGAAVYFLGAMETRPEETVVATVEQYTRASRRGSHESDWPDDGLVLEGTSAGAVLSRLTGGVTMVTNRHDGVSSEVAQRYITYESKRSGAYILRITDPPSPQKVPLGNKAVVVRGPVFTEAFVTDTDGTDVDLTVRVYNTSNTLIDNIVELVHTAKPPTAPRELLVEYGLPSRSGVDHGDSFYSDDGLRLIGRDVILSGGSEKTTRWLLQRNTYPLGTAGAAVDNGHGTCRLAVLGGRVPTAVGLQSPGVLAVWLHRNLISDDGRGLGEAVTESRPVEAAHWLLLGNPDAVDTERLRRTGEEQIHPMALLRGRTAVQGNGRDAVVRVDTWTKQYRIRVAPLDVSLPDDVHLLSLQAPDATHDSVVLRLWRYDKGIGAINKKIAEAEPARVDIERLFGCCSLAGPVERVVLTANQNYAASASRRRHYPFDAAERLPSLKSLLDGEEGFHGTQRSEREDEVWLSDAAIEEHALQEAHLRKPLAVDTADDDGRIVGMWPGDIVTLLVRPGKKTEQELKPNLPESAVTYGVDTTERNVDMVDNTETDNTVEQKDEAVDNAVTVENDNADVDQLSRFHKPSLENTLENGPEERREVESRQEEDEKRDINKDLDMLIANTNVEPIVPTQSPPRNFRPLPSMDNEPSSAPTDKPASDGYSLLWYNLVFCLLLLTGVIFVLVRKCCEPVSNSRSGSLRGSRRAQQLSSQPAPTQTYSPPGGRVVRKYV